MAASIYIEDARDFLDNADVQLSHGDVMAALRNLGAANNAIAEASVRLVQKAYDSGTSKAAIARSLDVPVSVFRGLRKTA